MRILVTGSRDWVDRGAIVEALRTHTMYVEHVSDVNVVHGGANGADVLAGGIANAYGMSTEVHVPNWDDCGDDCGPEHWRYRQGKPYCPRSGFKRNRHMVELGADICLAFIRNGSAGARMTARMAEKAGIPVHRYIKDD